MQLKAGWIDRNLPRYLLSEHGMAAAEALLTATKKNAGIREHLTEKMLKHPDTHFLTITMAEYVNFWDDLSPKEKELINQLISSNRADIRWIKAVMLTRKTVPKEIQEWVLGQGDVLNQTEEEIIRLFPDSLLCDCLRVYHGHPQPLWWIGLHHSGNPVWKRITFKLLERPKHPAFSIALRAWTDALTDGRYVNKGKQRELELWKNICSNDDESIISSAFHMLLQWTVRKVGVKSKELWEIFFEKNQTSIEKYEAIILDYVELISARNKDLEKVFGKHIFFKHILPKLNADCSDLVFIAKVKELFLKEDIYDEPIYELLKALYQKQFPRLYYTNNIVKNLCKKSQSGVAEQLLRLVEKAFDEAGKRVKKQKKDFDDHYDDHYELENWNIITNNS